MFPGKENEEFWLGGTLRGDLPKMRRKSARRGDKGPANCTNGLAWAKAWQGGPSSQHKY